MESILVYQTYRHECDTRGERGAYRRTGERYGFSDEWARKKVKTYLASLEPAGDDLAYEPPPGAYPTPTPPLILPTEPELAPVGDAQIMSNTGVETPAETPTPLATDCQHQQIERADRPSPSPVALPSESEGLFSFKSERSFAPLTSPCRRSAPDVSAILGEGVERYNGFLLGLALVTLLILVTF